MIGNKKLKKYIKSLKDDDKQKIVNRIKKIYEKNHAKVCRYCNIGFTKNDKYIRDSYGLIHIVCKYKDLKDGIGFERDDINDIENDIKSLKFDLKEKEYELLSTNKKISRIQKSISDLAQKHSDEIVKEAL